MSWSFRVPHGPAKFPPAGVPVADFEEAAKAALAAAESGIKQYNPDGLAAAELAMRAAVELVSSGVVGEGHVIASISGHGNPNHEAPPGSSKDTVSIQLTRTDA